MKITKRSQLTGSTNTMYLDVTSEQLTIYEMRGLVQNIFPNLSSYQREFIKSGITPEEWSSNF